MVTVKLTNSLAGGRGQHIDPVPRFPSVGRRQHHEFVDWHGGTADAGSTERSHVRYQSQLQHGHLHVHRHHPGTHSYYSGTQGDLQVEMGLFGALIVLP